MNPEERGAAMEQIFLSAPDVGEAEREALLRAFDSGWVAPAGPELAAFEAELGAATDREGVVALSSGTAALHLRSSACLPMLRAFLRLTARRMRRWFQE